MENNENSVGIDSKVVRDRRFTNYKIGSRDENNLLITEVYSRGDCYVIYGIDDVNKSADIKIDLDPIGDDKDIIEANFNQVLRAYESVKSMLYKVRYEPIFKYRIVHALVLAVNGDPQKAAKSFKKIKKDIDLWAGNQLMNKVIYLLTVLFISLFLCLVAFLNYYHNLFAGNAYLNDLLYVCAAGSIGGFISVSNKLKSSPLEYTVERWVFYVYAFERTAISVFAATIIYFILKSNLIFSIPDNNGNPLASYVVFGFLSGFSETLVPNLLIKLESKQ